MKDNQKRYLDKVIELLASGTKVDYNSGVFYAPYHNSERFPLIIFKSKSFDDYCKKMYGLTDDEIDYVLEQYRKIIYKINKQSNP